MKTLKALLATMLLVMFTVPFTVSHNGIKGVYAYAEGSKPVAEVKPAENKPVVAAPQEVPGQSFFDKIISAIKISGAVVAGILLLFEMAVRILPSKKPLSLLLPVKYAVDSLVFILSWLSSALLVPMIEIANKSKEKLNGEKKI